MHTVAAASTVFHSRSVIPEFYRNSPLRKKAMQRGIKRKCHDADAPHIGLDLSIRDCRCLLSDLAQLSSCFRKSLYLYQGEVDWNNEHYESKEREYDVVRPLKEIPLHVLLTYFKSESSLVDASLSVDEIASVYHGGEDGILPIGEAPLRTKAIAVRLTTQSVFALNHSIY